LSSFATSDYARRRTAAANVVVSVSAVVIPDTDDLRLLSGNLYVGLAQQTAHVRDGLHGGGDEPRQTEQRTDEDENRQHEQVEMISVRLLYAVHNKTRSET